MPVEFTEMDSNGEYLKYERKKGDAERCNLLEDALKVIPKHVTMSIDIKDNCQEALEKCIVLLKKYDRLSTTIVGDSSGACQKRIRKNEPRVCTMAGYD